MKPRLLSVCSILLLASLILGACSGAQQQALAFEKVALQRGSLTAYVVANGTVQPNRQVQVAWKTSGQVGRIEVNVLDTVSEGLRLGEIFDSTLPTNILSARNDLVDARRALDDLLYSKTDVEQARVELAQARDELKTANQKLQSVNQRTRPVAEYYIQAAQADLDVARKEVDIAQNTYDHTGVDDAYKPYALRNLATAKQQYEKSLYNLNYLLGSPSDQEIETASANAALAQAKVDDAQRKYDRIKDGLPAEDIAAAQMRIDIAQATLEQAFITAPFGGLVTKVFSQTGDVVQPGTAALQIEDQSHMYVIAQVSEIDINRMEVGQTTELTFDAVYGRTYTGTVVDIGVSGETAQGVVNFPVKIELVDRDEKVKSGMTATLRIQAETVTDVLLVPNSAVRMVDGQRVVYVDKGGSLPVSVPVTLGISSDLVSQVLEGDLKEGDLIVTNPDILSGPGL